MSIGIMFFVETFTISLLMWILLQFLMQVAIKIEHYAASFLTKSSGQAAKIKRAVSAYIILFISKLVIMEAINIAFGEKVVFSGPIHGVVAFLTVVIGVIAAEQIALRIYRALG